MSKVSMRTCERAIEQNRTEMDQQALSDLRPGTGAQRRRDSSSPCGQPRRQSPLLADSWAGQRAARVCARGWQAPPTIAPRPKVHSGPPARVVTSFAHELHRFQRPWATLDIPQQRQAGEIPRESWRLLGAQQAPQQGSPCRDPESVLGFGGAARDPTSCPPSPAAHSRRRLLLPTHRVQAPR